VNGLTKRLQLKSPAGKIRLYNQHSLWDARIMLKKMLPVLCLPLMFFAGCASSFTNLTPQHQVRNANNLYPVEVAFTSSRQALRWDSIKPQIVSGSEFYTMRPTLMMTNRWEGLVPVPPGTSSVRYRYKFDYDINSFGKPQPNSSTSPEYTLRIIDAK
jgi:hypothetical protein